MVQFFSFFSLAQVHTIRHCMTSCNIEEKRASSLMDIFYPYKRTVTEEEGPEHHESLVFVPTVLMHGA
jgi:hypothetical protein